MSSLEVLGYDVLVSPYNARLEVAAVQSIRNPEDAAEDVSLQKELNSDLIADSAPDELHFPELVRFSTFVALTKAIAPDLVKVACTSTGSFRCTTG
jgi:hypothetical protein